MSALAVFKPISADRKLSPVDMLPNTTARLRPTPRAPFCSSTYVSIEKTCPDTCTFKTTGCYVRSGFTSKMMQALDAVATHLDGDRLNLAEAVAIDNAFGGGRVPQDGARGGRDLRLHVGGDVRSARGAAHLARAAERWKFKRGGGSLWAYTARWREVPRRAWGAAISVLASVTTVEDAFEAQAAGYAPAIVMTSFPSTRAFDLEGPNGTSLRVIPCPAETGRGVTCVSCRLCLDRPLHKMNVAIGFALHGPAKGRAAKRLPVLKGAA